MRASACASPGKAEGETGRPPPEQKTGGGGGRGKRTADSHQTACQHHKRRPNPHPESTEERTPKEAQGNHPAKTGNTKPGTAAHREKGHRNMQTHTTLEKKRAPAAQPERKGMGAQGPPGPGQGQPATNTRKLNQDTPKTKPAENTPRQPNQEGWGTAETRAQHARAHTTSAWNETFFAQMR